MSDTYRVQLLIARNELDYPNCKIDEHWIEQLIGREAVRNIKADIEQRVSAEVKLRGIVELPLPTVELDLSAAGLAYWREVQEQARKEPQRVSFEPSWARKKMRKLRLRAANKVTLLPGGLVVFKPKLNRREQFIAQLDKLAQRYEALPPGEQARFTRDFAPHIGGLVFPLPIVVADCERARVLRGAASREIAGIRSRMTSEAWRDGLDKALGRNTGAYKIGGRIGVAKEGSDETSA